MTFAEILNQELEKQNISQKELADRNNRNLCQPIL